VLIVPRIGADAETDQAVCSAAGEAGADRMKKKAPASAVRRIAENISSFPHSYGAV
jgi:hypothetical protein